MSDAVSGSANAASAANASSASFVRPDAAYNRAAIHQQVAKRAQEDSALATQVLDTFSKELNLLSVDPVLVYDVASLRTGAADTITRHALGAGVRLTIASHALFTVGYA